MSGLHKCSICHYCYFLEINFRFQSKVCNGCHDLMQKAMHFSNVAIVSVKENNYNHLHLASCLLIYVKMSHKFI